MQLSWAFGNCKLYDSNFHCHGMAETKSFQTTSGIFLSKGPQVPTVSVVSVVVSSLRNYVRNALDQSLSLLSSALEGMHLMHQGCEYVSSQCSVGLKIPDV